MKNIIIGTAGHVDHGKTCLIKALSGFDLDRLKEEKKRGITIENGYAHLPNDRNYHIGIVDVPGHEKFIKNMLSGIGGIDIVLLVISLEEGIKPQTLEHFEILKSLGIKSGIIVFTKLDSENKIDFSILKSQITDLSKGTFLENAKMICVSAHTGQNIDLLKDAIFELIEQIPDKEINKKETRLPIDRVFTMEGFGTVVTGTLFEGQIDTGAELMLYPKMQMVKVRSVESHSTQVPSAFAGQRVAVNLLNVKKEEIERGNVLATKDSIVLSEIVDARLSMFDIRKRNVKNGERVLFNYGSAQTEATVKIISQINDITLNDSFYVQYKFDAPIPIKRLDKYIIRFMTPKESCGGGVILNVDAKKVKLVDDSIIEYFKNLDSNDYEKIIYEIIVDSSANFPNLDFLNKKIGICENKTTSIIEDLKNKKLIYTDGKSFIISNKFFDGIVKYVGDILKKFHKENPIQKGMKKEELKSILFKRYNKIGDTILENLLKYLSEVGTNSTSSPLIKLVDEYVALADFNVVLDEKNTKQISDIEKIYLDAKFEMPLTQDVVDNFGKDKTGKIIGEKKMIARQMIIDLAKSGTLIKINNDYYIHKTNFDFAVAETRKYFKTHDKMVMKDLRDLLGISRKYAILIIDFFDFKHITRPVGEEYRILYE